MQFFTYIATRMNIKYSITIIILCMSVLVSAQKEYYMTGLEYFEAEKYDQALKYFNADKYADGNKDLLIRRVISNYYMGNLDDSKKDISVLLAFDVYPDEVYLYIAKIFHAEGYYKKAAQNYKNYLRRLSPKSDKREQIIHMIKQCGEAIKLKHLEPVAFVDNYGDQINTINDEFAMIQSPNFDNKYYFTSARENSTGGLRDESGKKDDEFGNYNSDMYAIEMVQGKWSEADKLDPFINTSRDEIALGFSQDGSVLMFMKGPDYNQGTIYIDTFSVDKSNMLNPPKLEAPVSAEKGDVYMYLFDDNTIVFSSNRRGGYGGYDLYVTLRQDGKWSRPQNLGPSINSSFDEITPFLTNDGNTIYFSSNRVGSLGGYDMFSAEYNTTNNQWAQAANMGAPINSHADDMYLFVSRDGYTASLTSDRSGSFGGFDLYVVYFKNRVDGQLNKTSELSWIDYEQFRFDQSIAGNDRNQRNGSKASKKARRKRKRNKRKAEQAKVRKISPNKNSEVKEKDKEIQTYVINPLFYTSNDEIINATNKRELDIVAEIMRLYPSVNVEIKSHTKKDGLEAYDLYFSIKRAEIAADYLLSKNISAERVSLKGYGSNYPVAKLETGGQKSKIADKLNSRIEFKLNNTEELPLDITVVEPYLVDYLRDPRGELFKTVEDGLSYRVQIASVKQMYQNQVLLLYNDSMIEKNYPMNNYRYTVGLYEKYNDAQSLIKDLSNYDITGAFIVPYIDGQRIDKSKLVEYAKFYPDLINYMQYNDE